jgi:hypothetical protein
VPLFASKILKKIMLLQMTSGFLQLESIIQGGSDFRADISVNCQRIFMKFKIQIFWTVKVQLPIR